MSVDRILALKLITDVGDIRKQTKGVTGQFKSMATSAKSWSRALSTGFVLSGLSEVTGMLKDSIGGYKDGEAAADALTLTWRNMGLEGSKLGRVIEDVSNKAIDMGFDDAESLRGFNKFLLLTKDTGKAQSLLALAMDISRAEGISLSQAMTKAKGIYSGSARSVREYGLSADTAMGRVREARKKERGQAAKWAENHPMEVLQGKINEGFEAIAAVLVPLTEASAAWVQTNIVPMVIGLRDAVGGGDIAAQIVVLAAGIGVLAIVSYAHPLIALVAAIAALSIVTAIAVKEDWIGQLTSSLNANREAMATGSTKVDAFGQALVHLFDFVNDFFGPLLRPVFSIIGGTWSIAMSLINLDFAGFVAGLGEVAKGIVSLLLAPFQIVWNLVKGGFGLLGIDVGELVFQMARDIQRHIQNLIGTIRNIWNSIDIVIPEGSFQFWPAGSFDIPNPLGGYIAQLSWPRMGFDWTGSKDLIPDVGVTDPFGPKGPQGFKDGLWNVPHDMPAFVHQGESIVPADFARQLRGNGGFGGGDVTINIHASPGTDRRALGREIIQLIRAYEAVDGRSWRTAPGR